LPAQVDLRTLFDQALLQAAVVSKPDVAPSPVPAGLQQCFDRFFSVVTPSNLASLPSSSNALQ